MNLFVKAAPIEVVIKNCRESINKIELEIDELIKSKTKLVWEGDAYNKVISKYDEKIEQLKLLVKYLKVYTDVLELVVKNFGISQEEVIKKLNSLMDTYSEKI